MKDLQISRLQLEIEELERHLQKTTEVRDLAIRALVDEMWEHRRTKKKLKKAKKK